MSNPKTNLPQISNISTIPVVQEEDIRSLSQKAKERLGLKNVGKDDIPTIDKAEPAFSKETSSEIDMEKIALQEIDEFIPGEEVPLLTDSIPSGDSPHMNVYFIKFFGKDNKASSRLVKVPRLLPKGKDPIHFILEELKKGPKPEESVKGVLNSLPDDFYFNKTYTIKDGILHLDLGSGIEYGGGPQIIRDRLDQISHSLIGVRGIRGVNITIDRKKVTTLGGDGVPLPSVIGKTDRRVTTL